VFNTSAVLEPIRRHDVLVFVYSPLQVSQLSSRQSVLQCSMAGGLSVSDEGGVVTVTGMMGEKLAVAGGLCVSDEGGVVTVMDVMGYKAGSGGRDVDRLRKWCGVSDDCDACSCGGMCVRVDSLDS
jgi:hypothetical protein